MILTRLKNDVLKIKGDRDLGAKKIKGSKKDAQKVIEELATNPTLSKEWMHQHSTKILAGLVAVLLVVGVFWGFKAYGESKERRARLDYLKILQKWPGEEDTDPKAWEAVIAGLEIYIKGHDGVATARGAQLDLAGAYFEAQQYENAFKWNKKVLDERPRDQGFKLLAQYQMALIYEAMGKTEEALAAWNALKGDESSALNREADLNIARLYARKGEYAKAADQYQMALKAPGGYPGADLIQNELASLKLKSGPQSSHESKQ
jgi:predicted negative regulator of RcsB-dependent stress response